MSVLKHTYEQNMNKTRGLMGDVGRAAAAESCRFLFWSVLCLHRPQSRSNEVCEEREASGGKRKKIGSFEPVQHGFIQSLCKNENNYSIYTRFLA